MQNKNTLCEELKYNKALMHTKSNLLCSNNLIISFGENEHSCLLHSHRCPDLPGVTYQPQLQLNYPHNRFNIPLSWSYGGFIFQNWTQLSRLLWNDYTTWRTENLRTRFAEGMNVALWELVLYDQLRFLKVFDWHSSPAVDHIGMVISFL